MDNIIDKSTLIEFEHLCQDNDVDTLIFYDDFPMESPEYKEIYEFAWRLNALDDYLRKGRTASAICVLSELEGYLISDFLLIESFFSDAFAINLSHILDKMKKILEQVLTNTEVPC